MSLRHGEIPFVLPADKCNAETPAQIAFIDRAILEGEATELP